MTKINILDENILEQISLEKASLEDNPRFNLIRKSRIFRHLAAEANRHSVEIELVGSKREKGAKRRALNNLELAYNFLCKNCSEFINEEDFKIAIALLGGAFDEPIPYRNVEARVQLANGDYFHYSKVRDIHKEMIEFTEANNALETSVEKAVHSHFHICRIHPFSDGNGRLARAHQNSILDCNGYPPIIIGNFNRNQYLKLIGAAEKSYKDNDGAIKPDQAKFYHFLAVNLRNSLVKVKKNLRKR